MNAINPLWDTLTDTVNERGRLFEDLLLSEPVSLLNNRAPTHYHIQTNSYSTIDLSLCSSICVDDFEYNILESLHDSDHYPVIISWRETPVSHSRPSRHNTSRANWTNFTRLTETNIDVTNGTVNEVLSDITGVVIGAADATIPKTSGQYSKPPVPWWNAECREALRRRNHAERVLRRNYSILAKITYNRTRAFFRYTINQARKHSWQSYISSINQNCSLHQVWKRVQKIDGKFSPVAPPVLIDTNDNLISSPHAVSNLLVTHFSKVSCNAYYSAQFLRHREQQEQRSLNFSTNAELSYNEPFTKRELDGALSQTSESSPGEDGITYSMLKRSHSTFKSTLLSFFNRLYSDGTFPDTWRTAIIVPIPKPGKDSKKVDNYRPISLTSCLCKLIEKMVNTRLVWYLESNSLIAEQQAGFRANRSTTDHLTQLEIALRTSICQRLHTIAIFFDLQKAYDTAWRYGVLQKVHMYGLRGQLPLFLAAFLCDRSIRVRVGNILSDVKPLIQGIPQGSVLSCTLFLIAVNDLPTAILPTVKSFLYVDDFTILASGNNICSIERRLQLSLNSLQNWCNRTGFRFSLKLKLSQCTSAANTIVLKRHITSHLTTIHLKLLT